MRPDAAPKTVDLTQYPNLVVSYFGMPARTLKGVFTVLAFREKIRKAIQEKPTGLLRHDFILYSLVPLHLGWRQYWESFELLEKWARKTPAHIQWWQGFLKDARGIGIWHESYFLEGGVESIYNDLGWDVGLTTFAPKVDAKGARRTAKGRLQVARETVEKK